MFIYTHTTNILITNTSLLQFDPNPWCDANMRFTPMNIENYQLPDPTWQWVNINTLQ